MTESPLHDILSLCPVTQTQALTALTSGHKAHERAATLTEEINAVLSEAAQEGSHSVFLFPKHPGLVNVALAPSASLTTDWAERAAQGLAQTQISFWHELALFAAETENPDLSDMALSHITDPKGFLPTLVETTTHHTAHSLAAFLCHNGWATQGTHGLSWAEDAPHSLWLTQNLRGHKPCVGLKTVAALLTQTAFWTLAETEMKRAHDSFQQVNWEHLNHLMACYDALRKDLKNARMSQHDHVLFRRRTMTSLFEILSTPATGTFLGHTDPMPFVTLEADPFVMRLCSRRAPPHQPPT